MGKVSFSATTPIIGTKPEPSKALLIKHSGDGSVLDGTTVDKVDIALLLAEEFVFPSDFSIRYQRDGRNVFCDVHYKRCSFLEESDEIFIVAQQPPTESKFPAEIKILVNEVNEECYADLTELTELIMKAFEKKKSTGRPPLESFLSIENIGGSIGRLGYFSGRGDEYNFKPFGKSLFEQVFMQGISKPVSISLVFDDPRMTGLEGLTTSTTCTFSSWEYRNDGKHQRLTLTGTRSNKDFPHSPTLIIYEHNGEYLVDLATLRRRLSEVLFG